MAKLTRRVFLNTLTALAIGSIGGCQKNGSPAAGVVELKGSGGHSELTVGVVPPGRGACSAGRIYVASQNANLLMSPLIILGNGSHDVALPATGPNQNLAAFDNQFARLANGDLLLLWLAGTRDPLPLPSGGLASWWNDWNVTTKSHDPKEKIAGLLFDNKEVLDVLKGSPGGRQGGRR